MCAHASIPFIHKLYTECVPAIHYTRMRYALVCINYTSAHMHRPILNAKLTQIVYIVCLCMRMHVCLCAMYMQNAYEIHTKYIQIHTKSGVRQHRIREMI